MNFLIIVPKLLKQLIMKKIAIIICLLSIKFNVSAQYFQKNILAFDVFEADHNGQDYSKFYRDKQNYVTFYQNTKDSVMSLAIVWPNDSSMSYGSLTVNSVKINNELYEGNKTEKSYYKWYYLNSYNNEQGWATIEFSIVHDKNQPFYILRMFTENDFQINTYKGYLNEKLTGSVTEIK